MQRATGVVSVAITLLLQHEYHASAIQHDGRVLCISFSCISHVAGCD